MRVGVRDGRLGHSETLKIAQAIVVGERFIEHAGQSEAEATADLSTPLHPFGDKRQRRRRRGYAPVEMTAFEGERTGKESRSAKASPFAAIPSVVGLG